MNEAATTVDLERRLSAAEAELGAINEKIAILEPQVDEAFCGVRHAHGERGVEVKAQKTVHGGLQFIGTPGASDDRLAAAFDNPDDDPENPGDDPSPGTLYDKLDDDGTISIEQQVNGDGLRQVLLKVPSGAPLDTSGWCFG